MPMGTVYKETKEEDDGSETKLLASSDEDKTGDQINGEEDESESDFLLPPLKGEILKKSQKTKRQVKWKDEKLVEILEYEPSEASDSDMEDTDTCICTIM